MKSRYSPTWGEALGIMLVSGCIILTMGLFLLAVARGVQIVIGGQ